VIVELIGSFALQNIGFFKEDQQTAVLMMRLTETIILFALIHYYSVSQAIGLMKPNMENISVFIKIAVVCVVFAAIAYVLQPRFFEYVALPSWLHGVFGVLLMLVLAPVLEEIIFRGFIYRMLRERWGIVFSVASSALFFSLVHHGLFISPQLVGGVIFAIAYEWSRSLWVSIGLHIGANSAVYILSVLDFAAY